MAYCRNCGTKLVEGAKFCQKCGCPTKESNTEQTPRKQEFAGKIYKCPNCGEVLKAFSANCPVCGFELREAKATSAVKEFALKLEAIEARREYVRPRGFFDATSARADVSKTDEQKISLIKSFSVPNTKEDMLEFMILATSCINASAYDSFRSDVTKGEKEINAAWFAKVQQVYEKAKRSYSSDDTFAEIKQLYDQCRAEIQKSKKKGIVKHVLLIGWIPLLFVIILVVYLLVPSVDKREDERLEKIVIDIQVALEKSEYKYALNIADSIDYQGHSKEMERKWDIEKEYWVDKVLEAAIEDGIELEYTPSEDIDNANKKSDEEEPEDTPTGGFANRIVGGFAAGLQDCTDAVKENIDEFFQIIQGSPNCENKD